MKGRFAPSPTGHIHLGNVWIALLSYLSVRKQQGSFILRMEDIDLQRAKRELGEALIADLKWLGFDWDEGPYWQSERYPFYERILQKLKAAENIYPCYCNRARIQNISSAPHVGEIPHLYDGHCRHLSAEEQTFLVKQKEPSWRVKCKNCQVIFDDLWQGLQKFSLRTDYDDFVVRRADKMFAYNLAVVLDDMVMGVTEVIRGEDLLASTADQIFLQHMIAPYISRDQQSFSNREVYTKANVMAETELRTTMVYGHAPLLIDADGIRLSKRQEAITIEELRNRGVTASQILSFLAIKGGLLSSLAIQQMPKEGYGLKELVEIVEYPFSVHKEYIRITKLDLTKFNFDVY